MEFKAKDRRLEGDTVLRQCQLTQLYLLEVLDEICKKNRIRYFLDFGTLLGAVRHKGAIPWDDDLDVTMPETDFRRFMKIATKYLPDGILLQTPKANGGFFTSLSRLRDCYSLYCEPFASTSFPSGIFIDIYPLQHRKMLPQPIANFLFDIRKMAFVNETGNRISPSYTIIGAWKRAVMASAWGAVGLLVRLMEMVLAVFVVKRCWVGMPGPTSECRQFREEDIFPLRELEYEGRCFPVPAMYEKLLTAYYGDWHKLPDESDRRGHHNTIILPTQAPNVWWAKPYPKS